MMSTNTSSTVLLTMETLGLSDDAVYPAFLLGTLTYMFVMLCNMLVLTTIAVTKTLHKPMFILLCSLPISDMIGATAFYPHLLYSIVTQNRFISHPVCVFQAFLIHFYGTGNLLTLSAMAYDRYIAICCPLRYNEVMTPYKLVIIIVIIWCINISMVGTVILSLTRFTICRRNIVDLFCNNPSLMKLVCEDTSINNYFGLITIILVQGGPLIIITYTYAQILSTCYLTNQSDAKAKAFQTCSTHLAIYLILEFSGLITQLSHRIGSASPFMRRTLGVMALVFPPLFDPMIYGLNSKELKRSITTLLKINVRSKKP